VYCIGLYMYTHNSFTPSSEIVIMRFFRVLSYYKLISICDGISLFVIRAKFTYDNVCDLILYFALPYFFSSFSLYFSCTLLFVLIVQLFIINKINKCKQVRQQDAYGEGGGQLQHSTPFSRATLPSANIIRFLSVRQ